MFLRVFTNYKQAIPRLSPGSNKLLTRPNEHGEMRILRAPVISCGGLGKNLDDKAGRAVSGGGL
jgi:hypothetical protein